jgi:hypothetical protein
MYIKNGQFRKHKYIISYVPPEIYLQPIGGTKQSGDSHIFKIGARGSFPLTYQWYINNFPIFGATSNTLTIPVLQSSDNGLYYCRVENHKYPIDSDTVKLNVLTPVTITQQPSSIEVNPNDKSTFFVIVTGDEPISYQWYKNNSLLPYASKYSYIIPYTKITDDGNYYCIIKNTFDSLTTNNVTLTVKKPIQVVRIPSNVNVNPNTNLSDYLSCLGSKPISGYWRRNKIKIGSDIVSLDGNIPLLITNINNISSGSYDCVLSNTVNTITSNSFNIYVNEPVGITTQPVSANASINNSSTFTIGTSGTTPINYQWYSSDGIISGATNSSYTINSVQFSSQKNYWCVVSNVINTLTSSMVPLSVTSALLVT